MNKFMDEEENCYAEIVISQKTALTRCKDESK